MACRDGAVGAMTLACHKFGCRNSVVSVFTYYPLREDGSVGTLRDRVACATHGRSTAYLISEGYGTFFDSYGASSIVPSGYTQTWRSALVELERDIASIPGLTPGVSDAAMATIERATNGR